MHFFNLKKLVIFLMIFSILNIIPDVQAATMNEIAQKRKETKAKIFRLKILENQEVNKMIRNQQRLERNERDLRSSKVQFTQTKSRLENLNYQLEKANQEFAKSEQATKERIRQIYKKERMGSFAYILSSGDINSFLDRLYYQGLITKNDKKNLEITRQKSRRIAQLKIQVENERRILESSITNMTARRSQIKTAINNNSAMIKKLKTDRAAFERAERDLAKQSKSIEGMISKSSKSSKVATATGTFLRPCPGRITSYFGYRNHPIFKSRIFHSGIDIGAPYGTPIKATNAGKVIYTGWYGGYGKVVIIDHGKINGKPTSSLYAHQSRISVTNGQYVKKGTIVGYVGSTGYSTGPHLHFEIRINGRPSNPLNYIR